MLVSLAGVVAAVAFGSSSMPPWLRSNLDSYFLLRAPPEVATDEGDGSYARREFVRLESVYRVINVTPVFAKPPRGWRDPALASAVGLDDTFIVELDGPRADLDTIIARFADSPRVIRAWRDGRVDHCNTPDDTLWASQWNLQKAKLDCESVWDAVTGETVLVSVIDSGVDLSHKDLKANLWVNPGETAGNGKDDDGNGYIDDVNGWDFYYNDNSPYDKAGHGSHVAGIVGAVGDNGRDVAGVCWQAQIQVVQVLDSSGAGTWTSIAQGVVYAADNGALVTNMSLGGNNGDPSLDSAIAYARGLDVVQVAAAGNQASTTPFYPAAYDGVIAVMASDPSDKRPAWSNYGDWCDLLAPGDGVYSLWKSGLTNVLSGTSQAAPHVAGVAALLRTLNPQLDAVDVELAIETSCDDLGNAGKDSDFQWGRLNAREAVARASMLTLEKLSMPPGSMTDVYVNDAAHPGDYYAILPTVSDRMPGTTVDTFFGNGDLRIIPLNIDWITILSLNSPDIGVFNDFSGTLDSNGYALASMKLPKGQGLWGMTIHLCGFTVDPNDQSTAREVMNSVGLQVH
jgi:subtilisin family serine protease